jgi:hypothetical protein
MQDRNTKSVATTKKMTKMNIIKNNMKVKHLKKLMDKNINLMRKNIHLNNKIIHLGRKEDKVEVEEGEGEKEVEVIMTMIEMGKDNRDQRGNFNLLIRILTTESSIKMM